MLRCDPARTDEFVAEAHVERMVMQGREMNGWLRVADPALSADDELARWVGVGVDFVHSLSPR